MRWVASLLLAAVVLGGVWWFLREEPPDAPEAFGGRAPSEVAEVVLQGRTPLHTSGEAPWPEPAVVAAHVERLDGGDLEARSLALEELLALFRARRLTLDQMLDIVLLPGATGDLERLQKRVQRHLEGLKAAAAPLLPRLFDLVEGGDEREGKVASALLRSVATAPVEYLPRIRALLEDLSVPWNARQALLPLVESLGPEAVELAPLLGAWIRQIERDREALARANPSMHLSPAYRETDIQEALSALGSGAIPAILDGLAQGGGSLAYTWECALEELAGEITDELRALLVHADPRVRRGALHAVLAKTESPTEKLRLLRVAFSDDDARVRKFAVARLGRLGTSMPEAAVELVAALSDPASSVREAAIDALENHPDVARQAVPRLLAILRDGTYGEQLQALDVVAAVGPAARDAAPTVLALLADHLERSYDRDQFSEWWIDALAALGSDVEAYLVERALQGDDRTRTAALYALLSFPEVEVRGLAPLVSLLRLLRGGPRIEAAELLARHGYPEGVTALIEGLSDEDADVRVASIEGLQRAGPEAAVALPVLLERLRALAVAAEGATPSDGVSPWQRTVACQEAVVHLGPFALGQVLPLLAEDEDRLRTTGATVLAKAGEKGLTLVSSCWADLAPQARAAFFSALRGERREPDLSSRARTLFDRGLEDPSSVVRLSAAAALLGHRDLGARAVETLIALLGDGDPRLARDAAWRLGQRAEALGAWEEALREALPTAHPEARGMIRDMLERIEDR